VQFEPIDRLAELMQPVQAPWWVAAGWAVDLHLGQLTRAHADVDVLVLQRDLARIAQRLPAVYAERAETGDRIEWDGHRPLVPGPESLGIDHDFGGGIAKAQLLVGLADADDWVFHRGDGSVRRSLDDLTRQTQDGVRYVAPDIVLLFKSRQLRDKDTEDFHTLRPALTERERSWLRVNLQQWRHDHPWLSSL
jgi:hypothetical protein